MPIQRSVSYGGGILNPSFNPGAPIFEILNREFRFVVSKLKSKGARLSLSIQTQPVKRSVFIISSLGWKWIFLFFEELNTNFPRLLAHSVLVNKSFAFE